jgi:hypothetical protein
MRYKKNKCLWFSVLALVIVGVIFFCLSGVMAKTQTSQVSSLISFVDSAAQHLTTDGPRKALADFRDPAGAWIKGNNYLFVYDMEGNTIVLPPQTNLEGTNRMSTADPKGERYVETMVDILQIKNYGWNTYQYAKPNGGEITTKLSYFKKVSVGGKDYIVGSGIYLAK